MRQKRAQKPKPDIEQLAAEARDKRVKACEAALNKLLDEYKCQMSVVLTDSHVPLSSILRLSVSILISSKENG